MLICLWKDRAEKTSSSSLNSFLNYSTSSTPIHCFSKMWKRRSILLLLSLWISSGHCDCGANQNYSEVTCDNLNDLEDFTKNRDKVLSLTITNQYWPKPCLFAMLPGFTKLTHLHYNNGYAGMLSSGCLSDNPELRYVSMNNNRILTISFSGFNGGPIEKLYFNNNDITEAPLKGVRMPQLVELDLSKNNLESFEISASTGPKLRRLLLRRNKIRTIKVDCPMLTELQLAHNSIESFESSDFVLPRLEKLNLSRNRLIVVSSDMFKNAPMLRYLSLDHNALFNVGLPRNNGIMYVLLKHNKIRTIDAILFGKLNDQQSVVELSNNNIEVLESGEYRPNRNVWIFTCVHCKIKTVEPAFFHNCMPNLKYLNLANNLITSLDMFNYVPLPLHQIDLGYNLIDKISEDSLKQLPDLEVLALRFNKIRTISPGAFDNLPKLRNISLEFNCIREVYDNWLAALSSVPIVQLEANLLTYFPIPDNFTSPMEVC